MGRRLLQSTLLQGLRNCQRSCCHGLRHGTRSCCCCCLLSTGWHKALVLLGNCTRSCGRRLLQSTGVQGLRNCQRSCCHGLWHGTRSCCCCLLSTDWHKALVLLGNCTRSCGRRLLQSTLLQGLRNCQRSCCHGLWHGTRSCCCCCLLSTGWHKALVLLGNCTRSCGRRLLQSTGVQGLRNCQRSCCHRLLWHGTLLSCCCLLSSAWHKALVLLGNCTRSCDGRLLQSSGLQGLRNCKRSCNRLLSHDTRSCCLLSTAWHKALLWLGGLEGGLKGGLKGFSLRGS